MFVLPNTVRSNIHIWYNNILNGNGTEWPTRYITTRAIVPRIATIQFATTDDSSKEDEIATNVMPIAVRTKCIVRNPCRPLTRCLTVNEHEIYTYAPVKKKHDHYAIFKNETRVVTRRLCHAFCRGEKHCKLQEIKESLQIQFYLDKSRDVWIAEVLFDSNLPKDTDAMYAMYTQLDVGFNLKMEKRRTHESTQNNNRHP